MAFLSQLPIERKPPDIHCVASSWSPPCRASRIHKLPVTQKSSEQGVSLILEVNIMTMNTMLSSASRLALGDARVLMQRVTARLYTSSPQVQMGFGSHSSDNDPEVLDREKERNLKGQYRGGD